MSLFRCIGVETIEDELTGKVKRSDIQLAFFLSDVAWFSEATKGNVKVMLSDGDEFEIKITFDSFFSIFEKFYEAQSGDSDSPYLTIFSKS